MIDIRELRIGSHIKCGDDICRIVCIDADVDEATPVIRAERRDKRGVYHYPTTLNPDYIEPIPITSDLLRELGFEHEIVAWEKIINPEQWIYLYGDECLKKYNFRIHYAPLNSGLFGECRYLHELETFLYLTTKKELVNG